MSVPQLSLSYEIFLIVSFSLINGENMNLLHDLNNGEGETFYMVVEIPAHSPNKYEYDNETGVFRLDRVLHTAFRFPFEYGFIPRTWYDDNDPMDVILLQRYPTFPGCVIKARVIGLIKMKDEHGTDDKLVAVTVKDPYFDQYKDVDDIPSHKKDEIAHFLSHYKDLEKGKYVEVVGWENKQHALQRLEYARKHYVETFERKQ